MPKLTPTQRDRLKQLLEEAAALQAQVWDRERAIEKIVGRDLNRSGEIIRELAIDMPLPGEVRTPSPIDDEVLNYYLDNAR